MINMCQIFLSFQTLLALCSRLPSCLRFIPLNYLATCQSQRPIPTSLDLDTRMKLSVKQCQSCALTNEVR